MKKSSKSAFGQSGKLQDGHLTIGLDLGDRSSFYYVLNGAGEAILESRVATNPEAI
jgi:transposase